VVFLIQYLKDPGDLGITIGVTSGGVVTPLSVIRPYGRGMDDQEGLGHVWKLVPSHWLFNLWYGGDE
jgi:hypothetical protein